jgi:peptidoglycan/xylan/chitin deacetylase (PgdA/CDA1 family)
MNFLLRIPLNGSPEQIASLRALQQAFALSAETMNEYDELIALLPNDGSQSNDLEYVDEVLRGRRQIKVLDLGCDAGRTRDIFKGANADIDWLGVDIDDSFEARQRTHPGIPFKKWDGIRIPIDDSSIDLVYCHQVLEYVCFPQLVLSEVARVLKPGGFFIGSTSGFESCGIGSLWNSTPLEFKFLASASGLSLIQLRPRTDGIPFIARTLVGKLIARAFFGKPKHLSRYRADESPRTSVIDARHEAEGADGSRTAFEKLKYFGQFLFKATKSAPVDNGLPIITYHHHLPRAMKEASRFREGGVTNTVESFEEQMSWLHENGYSTVTLADFEQYLEGQTGSHKKVLITFDDGHASLANYCYEILKKYGFTAVVFLITGRQPAKLENINPNSLQYVSTEEMLTLSDVFEWAAHTHDLHSVDEKSISRLVTTESKDVIADATRNRSLTSMTTHFCFPFGQYNQNVIEDLSSIGFKYFYTTDKGYAFPEPNSDIHIIRRLNVSPRMSTSAFAAMVKG